jgi:predicted nucleic acid-binding Zn ribbon protein
MKMKDYKLPKMCGVCGSYKKQKRIYDVTSIHFTGDGFTKTNFSKGDEYENSC